MNEALLALHRALAEEHARRGADPRRDRGAYDTPWPLARRLVAAAYRGLLGPARPPPRLLDPACGTGVFLLAAFLLLSRRRPGTPAALLLESLHGLDIDSGAVAIARRVLLAAAGAHERRRGAATGAPAGAVRIRVGDALAAGPRARFDLVVGNPPWVSLAGKHRRPGRSATADRGLARALGGDSYRPNLFELFVRATLARLRPGGRQVFLVPDRLARNRQFGGLRRRMAGTMRIPWIEFGLRLPGVSADVMAYEVERRRPGTHAATSMRNGGARVKLLQRRLLERPDCPFFFVRGGGPTRWIDRLLAWPVRLGQVLSTHTGFIARPGALSPDAGTRPVLQGRHVRPFAVVGEAWFQDGPGAKIGGTVDPLLLGAPDKTLVPKTGLDLRAARDATGRWPEQSLYFLLGSAADLALATGLLNSRLARILYAEALVTNRESFPHLKKVDLDALPWPGDAPGVVAAVRAREGGCGCDETLDSAIAKAFGLRREEREALADVVRVGRAPADPSAR